MKVIKSKELSKKFEDRFICIDEDTGELLDDAQGYGYKTPQKAFLAYRYKHRTEEEKTKENEIIEKIKSCQNKEGKGWRKLKEEIETIAFYGLKDREPQKYIDMEIATKCEEYGLFLKELKITSNKLFKYLDKIAHGKRNKSKKKKN